MTTVPPIPLFIAYYRVSTAQQGTSGLGLDAQRAAVLRHVGTAGLLAEYTEVESGKRHTNRPQLLTALADCRKRRAVLVIAKLDRLARNVAFISALMESKTEFVCCDNPHANRLMLHLLAAVAEHEREMISERTKAALAAAKVRGTILGNPRISAARLRSIEAYYAKRPAKEVMSMMLEWRAQNWTYARIANEMNRLGIRPTRGRAWYGSSVRNLILPARFNTVPPPPA